MGAIANRYAESLFDLAKETNQIEEYTRDIKLVQAIFNEDATLLTFFSHVLIEDVDKIALIDHFFKEEVHPYICNFMKVLIKKRRMKYIQDICFSFIGLVNAYKGIEEGILYTSFDLKEEDIVRIQDAISKKQGKKVLLQVVKDKDLIGGIKVQLQNQVWDGSLQNQLAVLKKELLRK